MKQMRLPNRTATLALTIAAGLAAVVVGCKKKATQVGWRSVGSAPVAAVPRDAPAAIKLNASRLDAAVDCARTGPMIAGRSYSSPAAVALQAQIIQWCIDRRWASTAIKCIDNSYDESAALDCVKSVDATQAKQIADAVAKLAKTKPRRTK